MRFSEYIQPKSALQKGPKLIEQGMHPSAFSFPSFHNSVDREQSKCYLELGY